MNLSITADIGRILLDLNIGSSGLRAFTYIRNAMTIQAETFDRAPAPGEHGIWKDIKVCSSTGFNIYQVGNSLMKGDFHARRPWVFAWGVHFAEGAPYPHIWRII